MTLTEDLASFVGAEFIFQVISDGVISFQADDGREEEEVISRRAVSPFRRRRHRPADVAPLHSRPRGQNSTGGNEGKYQYSRPN